jgi:hypothetical protein
VNNDNTISVDAQIIQLMPTASHPLLVKAKVVVKTITDFSRSTVSKIIGSSFHTYGIVKLQ